MFYALCQSSLPILCTVSLAKQVKGYKGSFGLAHLPMYTGWAEKNVPNFKAVLLLNYITEKAQIWMV